MCVLDLCHFLLRITFIFFGYFIVISRMTTHRIIVSLHQKEDLGFKSNWIMRSSCRQTSLCGFKNNLNVDFILERNQDYLATHEMSWSSGCRGKSLFLQPLLLLSFTTSTPSESGLESTLVNPDEVKLKMSSTGDQHQTRSSRKERPSPSRVSWSELDNARSDITFLAPTVTSAEMPGYLRAAFTTMIITLSFYSGNHLSYITRRLSYILVSTTHL